MAIESGSIFSASGTWIGAGLSLPQMIVHDLYFHNTNYPECRISVSYAIDQVDSRRFHLTTIPRDETAEFHFTAGIVSDKLRFGTVSGPDQGQKDCIIHWVAMGYEIVET